MKKLRDDPSRVVILGAGRGGAAMIDLLSQEDLVKIIAVVDHDPEARGLKRAAELGIAVYTDIEEALLASAPCVVFNLTGNEMVEAVASDILGTGAVIGGMEARLMWRMVNDLREAKEKLEFQATHDELTGLYNRRHMLAEMERELNQVIRYHVPFSLALLDLDHFKKVNDTHGHAAGDAVLKHVADKLKKSARNVDIMGRWGGEEFLILLPHSKGEDAIRAVEKWLNVVRSEPVEVASDISITPSFSAGVAAYDKSDASGDIQVVIDRVLARADEHLYRAKNAGRGRVTGDR
jgi:diguanylate cyclase (GGDEF)-like protein